MKRINFMEFPLLRTVSGINFVRPGQTSSYVAGSNVLVPADL